MGFHCHNNKDHYRNTLHAPCRLEDRLGWVKVDYDRLVCLCLSALGGRSSTDIILQIDIHLSPLCSGSRRDISSCQHRWLFIPFCRHIDIFQTEARKKQKKKNKSLASFLPLFVSPFSASSFHDFAGCETRQNKRMWDRQPWNGGQGPGGVCRLVSVCLCTYLYLGSIHPWGADVCKGMGMFLCSILDLERHTR